LLIVKVKRPKWFMIMVGNAFMSTNCCILLGTFKSDFIDQCVTILVVFKYLCLTPKSMQRKKNDFCAKVVAYF